MFKKTQEGYVIRCDACGKTIISHLFKSKDDAAKAGASAAGMVRNGKSYRAGHYHPECKPAQGETA